MTETPVLIAGGGPIGLVLALELEHRGIDAILVERNLSTTRHPKMDVTNGRSMEHFRRLGIAEEIRSHGVPTDHPMSVVWCTRLAEWELARFDYPSIDWGRDIIRYVNDGSLPLEPDLRISQVILEPVLKGILETRAKHISVRFGWKLESYEQDDEGVTAILRSSETGETETIRALYLAGCDGAGSVTRKGLGIEYDELSVRDILRETGGIAKNVFRVAKGLVRGQRPPDGRIFLIHFRSNDLEFFERFGTAWHVQSPVGGTLIAQNDLDTWTLHLPLSADVDAESIDPRRLLFESLGQEFGCEIIVANVWKPNLVVAKSYGSGRVWLAGDSAHQVIPTGGYGMNTGVGDAVDLGWKLAATLKGWGGPGLLPSYEAERLPVGFRNRAASARHAAVRTQISQAYGPAVHEATPKGEQARQVLGKHIQELGNLENEALGIEIGYRYDDSPIICQEEGDTPAYPIDRYNPSTWPGVRAPSLFLSDGTALYDRFSDGFTLLRFDDVEVSALEDAAKDRGVPIEVVDIRDELAERIYEKKLVLLRPDQHVAWRGDECPEDPHLVVDRIRGGLG
ncbi:MAG: FAD-dependent monooxygenase [Deltaproteobacteria bacterium]|nr:FAD-dependent monooxygenase [Deltaproteobacteria bacterium]